MSEFNPVNIIIKREKVDFIVPERIRDACAYHDLSYKEAAVRCGIDVVTFGNMANGHVNNIPTEIIVKLLPLGFPKEFYYYVSWQRV